MHRTASRAPPVILSAFIGHLRVEQLGPRRFAIDGTPTDCVNLAINGIMPVRPDLVVSGINHGANMGDDITYSGTVSAAMEGTLLNVPSIAMSLAFGSERARLHWCGCAVRPKAFGESRFLRSRDAARYFVERQRSSASGRGAAGVPGDASGQAQVRRCDRRESRPAGEEILLDRWRGSWFRRC